MDTNALVGSWSAESGDSNIEFKPDGTYIRVSSFVFPMTYDRLAVDDEGTYATTGDTVTFTPASGHYRRNGVDEGFDRSVRVQTVRFEPTASGHNLILDDGVWTRA